MLKKILAYFFQGLLYTVPIAVTLYVIYELFNFIDGLLPIEIPGLGALILIAVITLLGFLGSTIIATPIKYYFRKLLDKVPLIKTIYSAIKDLMSAFVGQKKTFNQPVLVKIGKDTGLAKLGFVTREDLQILGIEKGNVAVYLPHSYNFSGNLFVVAAENVSPVTGRSSDVMKFIVSGGVTEIETKKEAETP